jgi:hypothetical protein
MSFIQKAFFVLCLALCLPTAAASTFLWEGFEHELNWWANDDSAATGRILDSENFSEGGHSLKLPFRAVASSARAAASRWEDMDWSPYGSLLFDAYNPTDLPAMRCVVVIFTGTNWVQYETLLPPLAKGWNRDLKVDLKAKIFRSSDTAFRETGYLVGRGEVKGVSFGVEPGQAAEGAVYFDNIRLEKSGVVTLGNFTLNTTLEGVASSGDMNYLPPGMRLRNSDFLTIESFESGSVPWTTYQAGVVMEKSGDFASQGSRGLSVSFPEIPEGFDLVLNGVEAELAGSRQVRMDVYNPGSYASVALKLQDTDDNYYSSYRNLVHGWNTLVFDFSNLRDWYGPPVTAGVLSRLKQVYLTLTVGNPGRLVFDGLATSSIVIGAAAKASAQFSLAYNAGTDFEASADTRVDDTFYGSHFDNARDGGAQASLSSAGLRYDLGGFRSKLNYNRNITAFDHPITQLLLGNSLGQKIAAFESSGRLGEVELQAVAASRLEFERYNSWVPTGLGPENVLGLRGRAKLGDSARFGITALSHQEAWGKGVSGLPASRQTWGADLDSHWKFDGFSVGWAAEGAASSGDSFHDQQLVYAPANDRLYYGTRITPEWGRLKLNYSLTVLGYDFDSDFTQYGSELAHAAKAEINLESLGPLAALKGLPLYDHSLGNNLHLELNFLSYESRSKYLDSDGTLKPGYAYWDYDLNLANDFKAKPSFSFKAGTNAWQQQWLAGDTHYANATLKFPLLFAVNGELQAGFSEGVSRDKYWAQSGLNEYQNGALGLDWSSSSNLTLHVSGVWAGTSKSWEGAWGDYDQHWRWTASAQKSLGSDSVLRFDYGQPVLNGSNTGLQDTLNVYTLTAKTYF